jgi:hypothetical protein
MTNGEDRQRFSSRASLQLPYGLFKGYGGCGILSEVVEASSRFLRPDLIVLGIFVSLLETQQEIPGQAGPERFRQLEGFLLDLLERHFGNLRTSAVEPESRPGGNGQHGTTNPPRCDA